MAVLEISMSKTKDLNHLLHIIGCHWLPSQSNSNLIRRLDSQKGQNSHLARLAVTNCILKKIINITVATAGKG